MIVRSRHSRPALAGRLALFLVCCCSAIAAQAHGDAEPGKPTVRAVLGPLPEALSGLHIELRRTLAPQLLVSNPTGQALHVLDSDGRAFLKIGPDDVTADLGDAAFHRSNTLMAPGAIAANASEAPRWQTVANDPSWGWFDLRLRTDDIKVAHKIVDAGRQTNVGQWSIPVKIGDRQTAIHGHFEFVPTPQGIVEARVVSTGMRSSAALVHALSGSTQPGLFMSYHGSAPLLVRGQHGEPMLRFTGQQVDVNRHSPTWAAITPAGSPDYQPATPGQPPAWARVSSSSSYGWIEPRAAFQGVVSQPDEASVVKRWRVPISIGEQSGAIQGVTEWRPITTPTATD